MKMIVFLIISLLFYPAQSNAKERPCEIIRVVDGDTVEIKNDFVVNELKLFIRIDGIDTPEKKGKCQKEIQLSKQAETLTRTVIKDGKVKGLPIICDFKSWDKYGGRILGELKIGNENLSNILLKADLAREYHGEKKKGWCEVEVK